MKSRLDEQSIALRVAREFADGSIVNLGYGMPGLCANFIPEGRTVYFQSENGMLGYGPLAADEEKDYELINASDQPVTRLPGMAFFDSAAAFDMIRGGHIDMVVLERTRSRKTATWPTGAALAARPLVWVVAWTWLWELKR